MTVHDLFINVGGSVKYRIENWNNLLCLEEDIIDNFDFEKNPFNNREVAHISVTNNMLLVLIEEE